MRLLTAFTGALLACAAITATAAVPNPTVSGPIASTAIPGAPSRDYVFFASDHPLAANGYIEEEYFIEGTANTYATSGTPGVITSGNPYKTRVVVRRPASQKQFNGTVLVEWYNVTNGFDAENVWFFGWEHALRAGYAWVGVSAQRVGVERMKTWNAARYGTLNISNDVVSYDAFMQAGQALRNPAPGAIDMMGGLQAKTWLAIGESQSAQRLATFINWVMPLGNVYDGAYLLSNFGQAVPNPVVPVFKTLFEWDLRSGEAAMRAQDGAGVHRWEVAGTAHVDHHLRLSREPLELRDLLVSSEANLAPTCAVPTIGSRVPNHYTVAAAIDHLVKWVRDGKRPPASPLVEIASFGPGNAATIARDSYNMAKGGIRLSQMEVPTAINVGDSTTGGACPRWGYHIPFTVDELNTLYPNRGTYLNNVIRVTKENVKNGFLLDPDAEATIDAAMASKVGMP